MKASFLSLILSAFIFVSANNLVYALSRTIEEEIGYAQIHPASNILYSLKMLKESLESKLATTTNVKAARNLEFATRRIREVRELAKINKEEMIEATLERYWVSMQDLLGSTNLKDERLAQETTEQVYKHLYILEQIYPDLKEKRAKMSVRLAINRISTWQGEIIKRLNKLSQNAIEARVLLHQKLACGFLIKEASSSALSETDKEIISNRINLCQKSLIPQ